MIPLGWFTICVVAAFLFGNFTHAWLVNKTARAKGIVIDFLSKAKSVAETEKEKLKAEIDEIL